MSEHDLEAAIAATNPPGPRLTPAQIEATIAHTLYVQPLGTTLTICVLVLRNGFTVTGESACADPANFNAEIGNRIARENAKEKIWALEGYLLRQRLWEAEQAAKVEG